MVCLVVVLCLSNLYLFIRNAQQLIYLWDSFLVREEEEG